MSGYRTIVADPPCEPWGSPIDRAAEALALHRCRMSNGAMENVAWRSVHPDVREEYIAEVRLVLRSVSDNPKETRRYRHEGIWESAKHDAEEMDS